MTKWQEHLKKAEGYLGLEMFDQAALELEEIESEERTRYEVLALRAHMYIASERWDAAAVISEHFTRTRANRHSIDSECVHSVATTWIAEISGAHRALLQCKFPECRFALDQRKRHGGSSEQPQSNSQNQRKPQNEY